MERQRKYELRDLNRKAWSGDTNTFKTSDSLDSSLKKNTAFIKRLRTQIVASSTATFLQEIRTLTLHKYLSEIISACFEGLSRLKIAGDIAAGVEIFSALHQRFGPEQFTCYIGWHLGRALSVPEAAQLKLLPQDTREKEEKERLSRHRILLRVVSELWIVGALRSLEDVTRPEEVGKAKENVKSPTPKGPPNGSRQNTADAEPFPLEVLKELTINDPQHAHLPMIVSFVKAFAWDLLGKRGTEEEQAAGLDEPLAEGLMRTRFKNVLTRYFEGAKGHLVREQNALHAQQRRNAEAYVRSGEIFEDRQANFEKQSKAQEKFIANMQALADALDADMPDLKDKDAPTTATDDSIGLVKTGEYLRGVGDGPGIWEDEDERRFYENLIDLKDRVPGILLEEKKKKSHTDEQVGKRNHTEESKPAQEADAADAIKEDHGTDQSVAIANKTVGAQVDSLLARLPELSSKDATDEVAVDFCFLNSKASRNRLIRAVQEVPKGRTDLLPLYSRLITTLAKYMSDVGQSIVSHLDEEFRSLQRRKSKDSLTGVRTSNIRYLAELTKFGLVPEHVIFHCLKVCLDEFSRMNIEIICHLLENCGRFLLRNPETSPRMKSFLETLQRKKAAQHIGQQERMLIENAVYYVDPPERTAILQKERTPVDLFVRKLVYIDMTKRNVERIAKQIRKLHWEEEEVVHIVFKILSKPWNIKYSNIHYLALILAQLYRYHQAFAISVIDDVLESITFGLELNDFKYNQRRLAQARYLGELYVYKLVDSTLIFDTMFKILTYGHGGWPKPDVTCPLDLPDDYFRIRLICTVIETCGMYFEKGQAAKKFDFFLTFFQYYIAIKDPMPMDIEFAVQDAFEFVRPKWKLNFKLEEAGSKFADACRDAYKNAGNDAHADVNESESDEDDDDMDDDDGRKSPLGDDEKSSGDEADNVQDDGTSTPEAVSDEEEHIIVTRAENERDPEAEADFDRELAKLMAESSTETRKPERRPNFDIALPMRRVAPAAGGEDSGNESPNPTPNIMQFSLLSKKGNRTQTRSIDLPADSTFAVAMRTQREAEKAEQQRIKQLVLDYDSMRNTGDETGEGEGLPPSLQRQQQNSTAGHYSERSGQGSRRGGGRTQPQARRLQLSDVDW